MVIPAGFESALPVQEAELQRIQEVNRIKSGYVNVYRRANPRVRPTIAV